MIKSKKWMIVPMLCLVACTKSDGIKERDLGDIENAIKIIESRRTAEYGIIDDQEREMKQLQENAENANTDGLREKFLREAQFRALSIQKAKRNITNQDSLLEQLQQKRDSMIRVENNQNK